MKLIILINLFSFFFQIYSSYPCGGKILCVGPSEDYPNVTAAVGAVGVGGGWVIQIREGTYIVSEILAEHATYAEPNQIIPFTGENVVLEGDPSSANAFVLSIRGCWWRVSGADGSLTVRNYQDSDSSVLHLYVSWSSLYNCGVEFDSMDVIANGLTSWGIGMSYTGGCRYDHLVLSHVHFYGINGGIFDAAFSHMSMWGEGLIEANKRAWVHDCIFEDTFVRIQGGWITMERNYHTSSVNLLTEGLLYILNGENIFVTNSFFEFTGSAYATYGHIRIRFWYLSDPYGMSNVVIRNNLFNCEDGENGYGYIQISGDRINDRFPTGIKIYDNLFLGTGCMRQSSTFGYEIIRSSGCYRSSSLRCTGEIEGNLAVDDDRFYDRTCGIDCSAGIIESNNQEVPIPVAGVGIVPDDHYQLQTNFLGLQSNPGYPTVDYLERTRHAFPSFSKGPLEYQPPWECNGIDKDYDEGCSNYGPCVAQDKCNCSGYWTDDLCTVCPNDFYTTDCDQCDNVGMNLTDDSINRRHPGCSAFNCYDKWTGVDCTVCPSEYLNGDCNACDNPDHRYNDNCNSCIHVNRIHPSCIAGNCSNNWFGENCTECPSDNYDSSCQFCDNLRQNINDDCNTCIHIKRTNPLCLPGVCEDYWIGENCTECPSGNFSLTCDSCDYEGQDITDDCNSCFHPNRDFSQNCVPNSCVDDWKGENCTDCDVVHPKEQNECKLNDCSGNWYNFDCNSCTVVHPQFVDECNYFDCDDSWGGANCTRCQVVNPKNDSECIIFDCSDDWDGENCTSCVVIHPKEQNECKFNDCDGNWYNFDCNDCSVLHPKVVGECIYSDCAGMWFGLNCTDCQVVNPKNDSECIIFDCSDDWDGENCTSCVVIHPKEQNECKFNDCDGNWYNFDCNSCSVVNPKVDGECIYSDCSDVWEGENCTDCPVIHQRVSSECILNNCSDNWNGSYCNDCIVVNPQNQGECKFNDCSDYWEGDLCDSCPSVNFQENCDACDNDRQDITNDCDSCVFANRKHPNCSVGDCINYYIGDNCDSCPSEFYNLVCDACSNDRQDLSYDCMQCIVQNRAHPDCEYGICKDYWTGVDCEVCSFDSVDGLCLECTNGFDPNSLCLCPQNQEPPECLNCINHFSNYPECSICEGNYDLNSLCVDCIDRYSEISGCLQCEENFDIDSQCTNCVDYWYGPDCDECSDLYDTNCEECFEENMDPSLNCSAEIGVVDPIVDPLGLYIGVGVGGAVFVLVIIIIVILVVVLVLCCVFKKKKEEKDEILLEDINTESDEDEKQKGEKEDEDYSEEEKQTVSESKKIPPSIPHKLQRKVAPPIPTKRKKSSSSGSDSESETESDSESD